MFSTWQGDSNHHIRWMEMKTWEACDLRMETGHSTASIISFNKVLGALMKDWGIRDVSIHCNLIYKCAHGRWSPQTFMRDKCLPCRAAKEWVWPSPQQDYLHAKLAEQHQGVFWLTILEKDVNRATEADWRGSVVWAVLASWIAAVNLQTQIT